MQTKQQEIEDTLLKDFININFDKEHTTYRIAQYLIKKDSLFFKDGVRQTRSLDERDIRMQVQRILRQYTTEEAKLAVWRKIKDMPH